jgi:hypothetical protein
VKFNRIKMDFDLTSHLLHMVNSYHYFTGKKLIAYNSENELAEKLYHAPFALVSHGIQQDPIFIYGNLTAQTLWEMNWDEFTCLPSRLSAEPMRREEREKLLSQVAQHGFAENYEGIRISKSGKRFWIKDVTVWNLIDQNKNRIGQSAMYSKWEFIKNSNL